MTLSCGDGGWLRFAPRRFCARLRLARRRDWLSVSLDRAALPRRSYSAETFVPTRSRPNSLETRPFTTDHALTSETEEK